jgi:hypothetical protein
MESLKNILSDIRVFLYGGILTLPLTLAGTLLIIGTFTANYAILFFLIGFLILTPLISGILDFILGGLFVGKSFNPFKAKTGDICKLIIPYSTMKAPVTTEDLNVVMSSWVAMVSFFLGYLFHNAYQLYYRKSEDISINVNRGPSPEIQTKIMNRRAQAVLAMISIILFGIIALGYRFYTGCESVFGMILTILLFVPAGYSWYYLLSLVGQDRLSDLFGIANRLLPPSALNNGPVACIPQIPKPNPKN